MIRRSSGILLPIFSLPGRYGIGSLGREARAFADFLHDAGQTWWQILPVGPTGAGDSPYTSVSTFAGNHLFIDLELLAEEGLLDQTDLNDAAVPNTDRIDYAALCRTRETLLRRAFSRLSGPGAQAVRDFTERNPWLKEYALYRAIKTHFDDKAWFDWPDDALCRHEADAVERWRVELAEDVAFHAAVQYWFFTQWEALKKYVNALGIRIIGDVPIYVPLDSADVWAEGEYFQLDDQCRPTEVAGVPPDYFTADGQLWGNPLYDWDRMRDDGYRWWIRRLGAAGKLYDTVRIDHFRGLESYWAVPYGETTARSGHWRKGPGESFIDAIKTALPGLDIIAEDLGFMTLEVIALREYSGFPGMKVLQFAFDSREPSDYLPHRYPTNCICYTGTHDNATLAQWLGDAKGDDVAYAKQYLGLNDEEGYVNGIIRGGMSSAQALAERDDVVISGHVSPDGYCLGSQLVLAHAARRAHRRTRRPHRRHDSHVQPVI